MACVLLVLLCVQMLIIVRMACGSLFVVLRSTQNPVLLVFFCVKQKTAYEMRISDWSSDVCSSDLAFYQRLKNIRQWMQSRRKTRQPVFDPGHRAALLLRDNIRFRQSIENVYMTAVKHAQKEVLIANAYFFPRRGLLKGLERVAKRGLRGRRRLRGRPGRQGVGVGKRGV